MSIFQTFTKGNKFLNHSRTDTGAQNSNRFSGRLHDMRLSKVHKYKYNMSGASVTSTRRSRLGQT